MLDLRGRRVVVVGAGPVGLRKAQALAEAGAKVTVVSRQAPSGAGPDGAEIVRDSYRPGLLEGATLVFACTDDSELNARIAADARAIGALVNAADQPRDCDFFLPARVCDGDVTVAIGTGGAAPALAAQLKRRLAGALPPRIGEFAALLDRLRRQLKTRLGDGKLRGKVMKELAGEAAYELFVARGSRAVRELLDRLIEDNRCDSSA